MLRNKNFRVLLSIMLIFFISSCATLNINKPLTQKQQATIWMDTYHSVYTDSMTVMKNPNATPSQKEIALKQRDILIKVWPLLKSYTTLVDPTNPDGAIQGGNEDAIIDLMNQLTALATGGK
jgi:hypothetical protein